MSNTKDWILYQARNGRRAAEILVYLHCCRGIKKKNNHTKMLHEAMQKYVYPVRKLDKKQLRRLETDILFCKTVYKITYYEYFIFGFEKLSASARREFIGQPELMCYCDKMAEIHHTERQFRDKYQAYQAFQQYYKRECIEIRDENDRELFFEFAERQRKFMLKALDQSQGKDVYFIDLDRDGRSLRELFAFSLSLGTCIVEEMICQSEEMGKFHSASVNTVRVVTFHVGSNVKKLFALLRLGSGGSCVDNVSAGGLFAMIDIETGLVISPGIRRFGDEMDQFLVHPDSGVQIIGTQIPQWEELLGLVDALAEVIPEQKYVGWDLALTQNGWIMVEGNHRPAMDSIQMASGSGKREWLSLFQKDMEN